MGQHGLINWADDDKECYELTLELIERAGRYIDERDKGEQTLKGRNIKNLSADHQKDVVSKIVPWLRGQVSQQNRFVATIESTKAALEFVNSLMRQSVSLSSVPLVRIIFCEPRSSHSMLIGIPRMKISKS